MKSIVGIWLDAMHLYGVKLLIFWRTDIRLVVEHWGCGRSPSFLALASFFPVIAIELGAAAISAFLSLVQSSCTSV